MPSTTTNEILEIVETGVPAELLKTILAAEIIEVPTAAKMLSLQAKRSIDPTILSTLYTKAAASLEEAPEERRKEVSRIWRSAIERAEQRSLPRLPSGNRALALAALEAVANAVSCWNLELGGIPLRRQRGKVFTQPGGVGKRLRIFWPGGAKSPLGPPAELLVWLECNLLLKGPAWFLEAKDLPLPFDEEAVMKCTPAASRALREYLWQMRGWNRKTLSEGQPVGGDKICKALEVHAQESKRIEGDLNAENPGGIVELLHKAASAEFKRITGIMPERYPLEIFTTPMPDPKSLVGDLLDTEVGRKIVRAEQNRLIAKLKRVTGIMPEKYPFGIFADLLPSHAAM